MNASVLIIGSGVAGLSSARRLYERGLVNIKILEARSYVGGRTRTISFGSSRVDMGAQWIHGQKNNSVYELARQHNLVDYDAPCFLSSFFNFSQLKTDEEKHAALNVCQFFRKLAREESTSHANKSIGQVLNEGFQEYLCEGNFPLRIKEIMKSVFDFNVKFECSLNGCRTLNDVSASLIHNYVECEGNPVTELKNKYSSFLKVLMDSVPPDCILLDSEVKKIEWGDSARSSAVRVKIADGSLFEADHVIVTVPLGYLKEHMLEMFNPRLPVQKQEAITEMGFGTLNKVFLHFQEPFWNTGDIFNVLWSGSNSNGWVKDMSASSTESGTLENLPKSPSDWTRGLFQFTFVLHQPHVLCGWLSGSGTEEMEQVPLEQVGRECHRILCTVLGDQNIPQPTQVARSSWRTDPFSLGSYSYLSMGCEKRKLLPEHIAEPVVGPRLDHQAYPFLLFAGEATHNDFFSTVHGAFDSGLREADRLLSFYNCAI